MDKKAAMVRTLKELKVLKEQGEIDLEKFAGLLEKYSHKLKMIETALGKLSKK